MKTRLHHWLGRSARTLALPVVALTLLLAALPTRADTTFTNTGWLIGVPLPGITVTDSSGQVYLKGNAHVARFLSDDARVTGRLEAWMDLAFQPDGTAIFCGPAYFEVGTWDATGTNFTATAGAWVLNYSGVIQTDGSMQYSMAGYGLGGAIQDLRVSVAATRANSDPATPYVASGTIKPAPQENLVFSDNFNDGVAGGWGLGANAGVPGMLETGGCFTINCNWTGVSTVNPYNTLAWAGHSQNWTVPEGQTTELRTELVALNPAADSAILAFNIQPGAQNYILVKGHNWLLLAKQNGLACASLCGVRLVTPDTGVVMSLALTKVGGNLVIAGRILDKAAPNNVLGQISYLDTPATDPVLSSQQIADLVGGTVPGYGPDPGTFWTSGGSVWVGVWQYTDGTKPAAEAVFDNVQICTYEVPRVGIERAVRLTWPTTGMNCGVEAAPTPNGPWLPVQGGVPPGCQQMTVPQTGPMQFFRAVQAP